MKPQQSFMSRIKSTLQNIWGNVTNPSEPLKVVSPIAEGVQSISGQSTQPTPSPTPTPYSQAPELSSSMGLATNSMPQSSAQTPEQYYPSTIGNPQFMQAILEADRKRPGLGNLLIGLAMMESTLGRGSSNIFGVLPVGEGAGNNPSFPSPVDALNYQLSPSVLGGGANSNMNILNGSGPLQQNDVQSLMNSYNPSNSYTPIIMDLLFPQQTQ